MRTAFAGKEKYSHLFAADGRPVAVLLCAPGVNGPRRLCWAAPAAGFLAAVAAGAAAPPGRDVGKLVPERTVGGTAVNRLREDSVSCG